MGVNLWEQTGGMPEEMNMEAVSNVLVNITDPMLNMSVLQSLNDLLDSVEYAQSGKLGEAVTTTATSYLTQAFPTLLGQLERTLEPVRMTTYTDKNKFLTTDQQYTLGRISARVPGVDYQQIPYIDAWGRTCLLYTSQAGGPPAKPN